MELTGKVIKVLEPFSGVSAKSGEKWVKNSFVIEIPGDYPKHVAFTVFGEDRWKQMGITVGGTYAVSFDVDAREYKGKWYNDISAWKAVRVDSAEKQENKPAPAPKQEAEKGDDEALPF